MTAYKSVGGFSFRKIHEFNVAMLGKQAWRFLTESNSLVARVFKARYFPSCSFLEAQLGYNPSYIWRSVMVAQQLIHNGVRWKIGLILSYQISLILMCRPLLL